MWKLDKDKSTVIETGTGGGFDWKLSPYNECCDEISY